MDNAIEQWQNVRYEKSWSHLTFEEQMFVHLYGWYMQHEYVFRILSYVHIKKQ